MTTLRAAGWFLGRIAPHSLLESRLVIDRQAPNGRIFQTRLFSAGWRVLREFGGLTIRREPGVRCECGQIHFDPLRCNRGWFDGWWLTEWQGVPIYPLAATNESILAMTALGYIIDSDDNLDGKIVEEALTNLILGEMPQVFEDEQDRFLEASYLLPWMARRFEE